MRSQLGRHPGSCWAASCWSTWPTSCSCSCRRRWVGAAGAAASVVVVHGRSAAAMLHALAAAPGGLGHWRVLLRCCLLLLAAASLLARLPAASLLQLTRLLCSVLCAAPPGAGAGHGVQLRGSCPAGGHAHAWAGCSWPARPRLCAGHGPHPGDPAGKWGRACGGLLASVRACPGLLACQGCAMSFARPPSHAMHGLHLVHGLLTSPTHAHMHGRAGVAPDHAARPAQRRRRPRPGAAAHRPRPGLRAPAGQAAAPAAPVEVRQPAVPGVHSQLPPARLPVARLLWVRACCSGGRLPAFGCLWLGRLPGHWGGCLPAWP